MDKRGPKKTIGNSHAKVKKPANQNVFFPFMVVLMDLKSSPKLALGLYAGYTCRTKGTPEDTQPSAGI